MQKQKVTGHIVTGFILFFVERIQDFFQTIFLFSRLKVTVRFFMAQEEITVLTMTTMNLKKFSFNCLVLKLTVTQPNNSSILNFYHKASTSVLKTIFYSTLFQQSPWVFAISV